MSKKILMITGSPRKNGNSESMANAFIQGATEHGHSVERFDAAFKNVAGCIACDQCWSNGNACVRDDDWQEFSQKLERADVVVFAYPLYWSTMPAQLKAVVDRLYSYCSTNTIRPLTGKQTALLLCGECIGQEIFADALHAHEGINAYFSWKCIGTVCIDGVFEKGKIQQTTGLEQAYRLGLSV